MSNDDLNLATHRIAHHQWEQLQRPLAGRNARSPRAYG